MKVLVVGSGAREHALAWKIAQSPQVEEVLAAPGNPGTAQVGRNLSVSASDLDGLVAAARREEVGLVVIGPEAPLVAGLADRCAEAGILAFGPSEGAAQLEASKSFSKDFMKEFSIPTAEYAVFTDASSAKEWVRERGEAMVVKADGLAGGKGVIVASSLEETLEAIDTIMVDRRHGEAGARIVVEECLVGPEVSFHVICDGERYVALAAAQDHKRLGNGDQGPNTGGMGAYSPPPAVTQEVEAAILADVVEPTLAGMQRRGLPFRGVLFIGLMVVNGKPKVLEYNVRFGDPETEVLMARWKGDALPLFLGAARGDLSGVETAWDAPAALCVVMASEGYPRSYPKGRRIQGVERASELEGVEVFQAGTKRDDDARLVTSGGRVLCVTACAESIDEAARRAYAGVNQIRFEGAQLRTDIGWQARSEISESLPR